jgi:hypothetical protein
VLLVCTLKQDLGSDGMPVKVVAAFGALPAMIDAWVLTRGRATFSSMAPGRLLVRSSSDLRVSFEVWLCECASAMRTYVIERRLCPARAARPEPAFVVLVDVG